MTTNPDSLLAADLRHAGALHALGVIRAQSGDAAAALDYFDRAIACDSGHDMAYFNRGIALKQLGQTERAITVYRFSIGLKPGLAQAYYNLAMILHEQGLHDEALADSERAIPIRPDYAKTHSQRGNSLLALDHPEELPTAYDRALALDPAFSLGWCNRGVLLQAMNRLREALDPAHAEDRWNRAVCLLLAGDFIQGWPEYEWRWRHPGLRLYGGKHSMSEPRLTAGADLRGKTVLLYVEQRLGDTLQFCQNAARVGQRGARVWLQVQHALQPLLQGLEGVERVFSNRDELPVFDLQCPLLSLPAVFGATLDSVPARESYIQPSSSKLQTWRERLGPARRWRIGLVWSGSPKHRGDCSRSIALSALLPLFTLDAYLFSLQKELRFEDAQTLGVTPGLSH
ncbi:MAG: tetratricopeptide repeat protein [Betaproteobacteria bacterium]|jgi:tetratricopeptide (TPR) repeat protein|nr:tetratricopeptide repeat protein [Betaproteobacteria bacterium]